jgi:hypothetical protein
MRRVRILKVTLMGRRELQAKGEAQMGTRRVRILKVKGQGEIKPLVALIRPLGNREVITGGLGTSRG